MFVRGEPAFDLIDLDLDTVDVATWIEPKIISISTSIVYRKNKGYVGVISEDYLQTYCQTPPCIVVQVII